MLSELLINMLVVDISSLNNQQKNKVLLKPLEFCRKNDD